MGLPCFMCICDLFQSSCGDDCDDDNSCSSTQPDEELVTTQQSEELPKVMCRFSEGTENRNEDCASADKDCTTQRIARERLPKDQSREGGVEDETRLGQRCQRAALCLGEGWDHTAWSVESTGNGRVVI